MKTVIVHGPMASGKTRHAEQLRRLFGCKRVVDNWNGRDQLRAGDLALTIESPPFKVPGAEVVSIGEAVGNLR